MSFRGNKIIAEQYLWGLHQDTPHIISSVTKLVTSILTGIALDLGKISFNDVISDSFILPRNRLGR